MATVQSEMCYVTIDLQIRTDLDLGCWVSYYDGIGWAFKSLRVISNNITVQSGTNITIGVAYYTDEERTDVYTHSYVYNITDHNYIIVP